MSNWTSIYPELAEDPKQKVKETFDMDGDPGFSLAANNKNVYKLMDNVIGALSDTFENINIGLDEIFWNRMWRLYGMESSILFR